MPSKPKYPNLAERDGTSQDGRALAALDPGYAVVDERTPEDLLEFVRAYSRELTYYGMDGKPDGDWSGFVSPTLRTADIAAFLREPERYSAELAPELFRPHFTLFLAFLQLYEQARASINTIGGRHLDFYYRQLLRMTGKRSIPDRVNVIVDLDDTTSAVLLPRGSQLDAGQDSSGVARVYETDRDLVVNRAQLAQKSSLFIDRRRTALRDVPIRYPNQTERACEVMFAIALGDPLPLYPDGARVDYAKLVSLRAYLTRAEREFYLPIASLRELMLRKQQRPESSADWADINALLVAAAKRKGRTITIDPSSQDFYGNIDKAVGPLSFTSLPQVSRVDDLYDLRSRADVAAYIVNTMYFASVDDFARMMQNKQRSTGEWTEINALLTAAAKRKGRTVSIDPGSQDFYGNVTKAVGPLDFGTLPQVTRVDDLYDLRGRTDVATYILGTMGFASIDDFAKMMQLRQKFTYEWTEINRLLEAAGQRRRSDSSYKLTVTSPSDFATNVRSALGFEATALAAYWQGVVALERYFCMPAEGYAFALDEVTSTALQEWDRVFDILEDAHREALRQSRRAVLKAMHEGTPPARLVDLIRYVLGEAPDASEDATATDRLEPYLGQSDADKVGQLAQQGDWERVYGLLEFAQRSRLGEPLAERSEWLNLYPAADATVVRSSAAERDTQAGESPRFSPFGAARPSEDPNVAPAPVLGWALSSPLLALSEGRRVITLTLGFRALARPLSQLLMLDGALPLRFEISTAKGFIECAVSATTYGAYAALSPGSSTGNPEGVQFVLVLPATADPIAALPTELAVTDSPWPVLRLMLRPLYRAEYEQHVARYPELSQLELLAAHIKVEVSGLRSIYAQNDEAVLEPQKPFLPFGNEPAAGSRFLFGHPELVGKALDTLLLDFTWLGAPKDLRSHYSIYGLADPPVFSAKVSRFDRSFETVLASAAPLFRTDATTKVVSGSLPVSIAISRPGVAAVEIDPAVLAQGADEPDEEVATWRHYFQWELNDPDFQHSVYPTLAAKKSVELAALAAQGTAITASNYQVPPPYTPKLKSLTLGYTSSTELRFDDVTRPIRTHRVLHVHPFGCCDVEAERTSTVKGSGVPFLPRYDNDGELYLGLSNVEAPQTVSLFFQLAEGTADANLDAQAVDWSYLAGDRWLPLEHRILSDTTRDLSSSGIIELDLPQVAPSTRLRGDLYWLRAAVARDTASVCDVVGIHTQAVGATFVDRGNADDHFRTPLPAGTITQLVSALSGIEAVRQPYTSYGGRPAEDTSNFSTRVSERLRHKGRALTMWDYERLVLDRFPELHKVKCIPGRPEEPGKVVVLCIPDIRNKLPFEPSAPKAPANLLVEVREYLEPRAPAFATIEARNARYVTVQVRLGVRFRGKGNEAFYKQKLNEELNRFLSPWAYDEGADIAIGGRIYASSIVDFVDRRPYVDYVAGIKLFRSEDGVNYWTVPRPAAGDTEGYSVGTEHPDQVLVAAPSHEIDVLSEALYEERLVTGIGFMKLELDFVVGEDVG